MMRGPIRRHERNRTMPTDPPTSDRKRVLFVAEAVTLAHVARPLALARGIATDRYEASFACDRRYADFIADEGWPLRPIESIESARFTDALARGRPPYDVAALERYVEQDLAVLHELQPDVVIGDFRLSLSVSARVAGIPYATIASAYWSPFARQRYPVPDHPLVRIAGVAIAQRIFDAVRPAAFARYAAPLNQVRRSRGMPSLGNDLRRTYTDADFVLYADPPELVALDPLPASHRVLGPVIWSPQVALPAWWDEVPDDKPIVYVTMGSSGSKRDLAAVLDALAGVRCSVMAATASDLPVSHAHPNAFVAKYLPGDAAARRARLVVCNGGSPTSHQSLAAGVPVLGIARNLDQYLNMQGVERAGAGRLLRSDQASPANIACAVVSMLDSPRHAEAAAGLAASFRRQDACGAFAAAVDAICASGTRERLTRVRPSASGP
jgi:UDP:flavonoid glycosyltransferase YjiC (YdhE family)